MSIRKCHAEATTGISETVNDIVFRKIREDIISGTLAPGARKSSLSGRGTLFDQRFLAREILSRLTGDLVMAERAAWVRGQPGIAQGTGGACGSAPRSETHAIALSFAAGNLEWESRIVAAHHKLAAAERSCCREMRPHRRLGALRLGIPQAIVSACDSRR